MKHRPMNAQRALEILHAAGIPRPAVLPSELTRERVNIWSGPVIIAHGSTIDEAMHNAREFWEHRPPPPRFTAHGEHVVREGTVQAVAISKTMALRICNALNLYNPDLRKRT